MLDQKEINLRSHDPCGVRIRREEQVANLVRHDDGANWASATRPAIVQAVARTILAVPSRQVAAIGLPPGGDCVGLQLQTRKSASKTGVI